MQNYSNRDEMVRALCKEGQIGAEIGVFAGDFSDVLLSTNPKKLFLIDCWKKQTGLYELDSANDYVNDDLYVSVINRFKTNSNVIVLRMFSEYATQLFPDMFFDWIYLDANHTYEAVKEDLKNWLPKIKIGGLFLGHDYFMNPFVQVQQAVDEFIGIESLDFLTQDSPSSWGFIKKIKKRGVKYI